MTTGYVALRGSARHRAAAGAAAKFGCCGSIPAVAEQLGVGPAMARRLLIEAGVRTGDDACLITDAAKLTAALVARYRRGETIAQLTWATGIDRRAVRRLLTAGGVPKPPRARAPGNTEAVVAGYRAGASIRELAEQYGSSYTAVRTLLVHAGVRLRARTAK